MPSNININIVGTDNDSLHMTSAFFQSNKYVGTQWDNNQTTLVINVPVNYTQYSLTLKFQNSMFKGSVTLGNNYSYTLVRPITASEELEIDCLFYDGDTLIASTGKETLYFRQRIIDGDYEVGEFNSVPYYIGGVTQEYVDNADGNLQTQITDLEQRIQPGGQETDPVFTAWVSNVPNPSVSTDATNKEYVDTSISNAIQSITAQSLGINQIMPPEVLDYSGSNVFTLLYSPSFFIDVMILTDSSFQYLQSSDYSISGNSVTINNPALNTGDKLKFTYVI